MDMQDNIKAALDAAGIKFRVMTYGSIMIDRVSAPLLFVSVWDRYIVKAKIGKRWRTLGRWKTPARVIREIESWT